MRSVSVENDKSAPVVEAGAKLDTSAGSFVNSRRKSLSQIENNFKGMDADSAAKLNEGVETDDRSHAKVEMILDEKTTLFLESDSELFRLLHGEDGRP